MEIKKIKLWYKETIVNTAMKALEEKNYAVSSVPTKSDALKLVMGMIPEGSTVGTGGSMTVSEVGLLDAIEIGNFKFYNQYRTGLSEDKANEMRTQGLLADYYITGTNAITITGELINLDGFGNRVAAITYGPKKVIIIVGINKFVNSIEEGIHRVRHYAAVLNSKRFNRLLPCTETGKCNDCHATDRICNHLLVTYRQHKKGRVSIVIVDEELGF
ncbi:MAG: lactate utilization protein [Candidatus Stahlbacteria bacterium]|nr:lactate utilization protein [Candidatus Stahlbacteria bacterium]